MPSRWLAASLHRLAITLAILSLAVLAAGPAEAQILTVSGSPAALHIVTAVAGSAPTPAADAATTYTTAAPGAAARQITAQLDSNMPLNTILTINLTAVAGTAVSAGTLTLTTTAQSVVTNITNNGNRTAAITYTFSATVGAGVIASSTRTVTFTLVAFP